MSMYVRVKREKLTVFMHLDPTDTIAVLKDKLQELVQKPAADQQLYKEGVLLEDDKTLAELRVENDDELAVAYRSEGKPESLAISMVLLLLLLAATMHKGCIHLHSNQRQQDLPCASGSAGGEFEPLTVMPFDGRVPVNDATSVN
ncbi:Elongin-B [Chlorella vulgaris]